LIREMERLSSEEIHAAISKLTRKMKELLLRKRKNELIRRSLNNIKRLKEFECR
jgi:hypothetical protein